MSAQLVTALKILLILAAAVIANAMLQRAVRALSDVRIFSGQFQVFAGKICKWTIIIIAVLLAAQQAGISVHSVWTSLSAVMVLVAVGFIAFWSILSNVSAALLLVLFAPFRIGDEIEILEPAAIDPEKRGVRGRVVDISFLYTTLVENDEGRALVRLPNSIFFQKGLRCRRGEQTESLRQNLFERDSE